MAAGELLRHAVLSADQRHVVGLLDGDLEAVATQILGVLLATAALRVLVHQGVRHLGARRGNRERRSQRKHQPTKHRGSPRISHCTRITPIMPLSWCSRTWQWNIQSPGLSATKATSTR